MDKTVDPDGAGFYNAARQGVSFAQWIFRCFSGNAPAFQTGKTRVDSFAQGYKVPYIKLSRVRAA
jgi:hypothetical protein